MKALRVLMLSVVAGWASAQAQDAKALLEKVDAATKAVKGITCQVEVLTELKDGKAEPFGKAQAKAERIPGAAPFVFKLQVDSKTADDRRVGMRYDGKVTGIVLHADKNYMRAEGESAQSLAQGGMQFFMIEYMHPTPFSDEINGASKLEGEKDVAGVKCNVVYVKYADNMGEARWYFGKQDNLPRRVDRIGEEGQRVTIVSDVKIDPTFDADTFTFKAPEGFTERKAPAARAARESPSLLTAGSEAPDWTLETPTGEKVTLKSLRGKVVLMDFWAVWCGPCKAAMPGVQKLHEKYKDKGVLVYGVNCWEKASNDPAAFMKDKNYNYGLLMKGDDVATAYKVAGIPTFYVIGRDGKIVFADSGSGQDEKLEAAIEKALAGPTQ